MKEKPPPKTRSYGVDSRHVLPMLRVLLELATVRLASSKTRRHVIQLGRSVRQHAFDARDTLPIIDHPALSVFLGCNEPREIILPPIDTISLSGLGFVVPYTLLATVVSARRPKKSSRPEPFAASAPSPWRSTPPRPRSTPSISPNNTPKPRSKPSAKATR